MSECPFFIYLMQISFLIANLGIRGSVRRVVSLSNKLIERGHTVTIYHSDGSPCDWLHCLAVTRPLEAITADRHDLVIYFGTREHAELVRQTDTRLRAYYVLGINERQEAEITSLMLSGKPVVDDDRTLVLREAIQDREHLILANCSALANWLKQFRPDIYPVYGGVDFDIFQPNSTGKVAFRIVAGGAKREIEGTEIIKRSVETAQQKEPHIELKLYAGMGYSQAKLAELYSSADVYLDAQHHGGWNNPVAEAMACKTAVICTDIWGNHDFAHHLKTAYITDDNPEALAAGLLEVLKDGELRRRMVVGAYEMIRPFTWDRATDQLEAAIPSGMRTPTGILREKALINERL